MYRHAVVHKCLCFWSEVMFSISLHFVFAVKPSGTKVSEVEELSEVEEVNEIQQEVPNLGKHIEFKA